MERINYPYELGKAGIPFEKIFKLQKEGRIAGIVDSGSGKKLNFRVEENLIEIRDAEFQYRYMRARVEDRAVNFSLYTTYLNKKSIEDFPWERHPDLFADRFVGIALQYFEDRQVKIEICRDTWMPDSDNFIAYREELNRSGDKVKAAKNTWSGKIYAKYGFSEIGEKDIKLGSVSEDSYCVLADFHRADLK